VYTRASQISVVYTSRQVYLQLSGDAIRGMEAASFAREWVVSLGL